MSEQVPFYSSAATCASIMPRLEHRLREIAASGVFTNGPMVAELEHALEEYTAASHVVALGSGTDALVVLLKAAGIGAGDEVIVPAFTFAASVSAVLLAGASPIFVDITPGSYGIDPERVVAALSPATKALMAVHLFSQPADLPSLRALADANGIMLIEDSAEAIGMRLDGRHAGLWGRGGILSNFPTKTLGAFGDAGTVITDDDQIAVRARRLRSHGQKVEGAYIYDEIGFNSRCDEIQAAVLLTRLETIDDDIARRSAIAGRYTDLLAGLAPIVTTPRIVWSPERFAPVYYVYAIETDRRDALARFLARHGVGTEIYYPRPVSRQPFASRLPGARQPIPVAAAVSRRALALPLCPDLADSQIDHVCELVARFAEGTV
jgi:UDP-2-acetamido-2-deoxy-ribo-hexuluronate aminotransferase